MNDERLIRAIRHELCLASQAEAAARASTEDGARFHHTQRADRHRAHAEEFRATLAQLVGVARNFTLCNTAANG